MTGATSKYFLKKLFRLNVLNVVLSESKEQWNLNKGHITNFYLSFSTPYVCQFTLSSASCYNFKFFFKSHIKEEFSRTILSSHVISHVTGHVISNCYRWQSKHGPMSKGCLYMKTASKFRTFASASFSCSYDLEHALL